MEDAKEFWQHTLLSVTTAKATRWWLLTPVHPSDCMVDFFPPHCFFVSVWNLPTTSSRLEPSARCAVHQAWIRRTISPIQGSQPMKAEIWQQLSDIANIFQKFSSSRRSTTETQLLGVMVAELTHGEWGCAPLRYLSGNSCSESDGAGESERKWVGQGWYRMDPNSVAKAIPLLGQIQKTKNRQWLMPVWRRLLAMQGVGCSSVGTKFFLASFSCNTCPFALSGCRLHSMRWLTRTRLDVWELWMLAWFSPDVHTK